MAKHLKPRRGQAATEYLIILSVVVIIALIVVGVLRGFASSSSGDIENTRQKLEWQSKDVVLEAYTIYANGHGVFLLQNRLDYPIKIVKATVGQKSADMAKEDIITPGSKYTLDMPAGTIKAGSPRAPYTFDMEIKYSHSQYPDIVNTVQGTISGSYE
ncbi:MAG: hypothetical protein WC506_01585 [Candidatus Micrarchaeia archaeon]